MKLKTDKIELGSKGYFGLAVYKKDGTEVVEKRVKNTDNVVTYAGAYSLFFGPVNANLSSSMRSQVGTGTVELTRASTGLTTLLETTSNSSSSLRSGNEVSNQDGTATMTSVRTNSFSLGEVVGTISEVGLSVGTSLFIAGQLIKDEFGNPTTVTILADEQLVITYTLVLTYPDGTGNFSQAAPLLGTGTVTTPSGTSDYSMYGQPLFKDYLGTSSATRASYARREYLLHNAQGNPVHGFGQNFSAFFQHDGTTGVTAFFSSSTISPTDFSHPAINFISAGTDRNAFLYTAIDPVTKLAKSTTDTDSKSMLVIEFTPPLVKTNQESMTVYITIDYQI